MSHYRLFCIDSAGRFFRCEEFEAEDDERAGQRSAGLRGAYAAELWSGSRLVRQFAAPSSAATA